MLFTFTYIYVIKNADTSTLYNLFHVPPIRVEQSVVQAGTTFCVVPAFAYIIACALYNYQNFTRIIIAIREFMKSSLNDKRYTSLNGSWVDHIDQ